MTSLPIILIFINYLLLSSANEGDARGHTLNREGNVCVIKCIDNGSEDVMLEIFLLVNFLSDRLYPKFNQTFQISSSVLRSTIEKWKCLGSTKDQEGCQQDLEK